MSPQTTSDDVRPDFVNVITPEIIDDLDEDGFEDFLKLMEEVKGDNREWIGKTFSIIREKYPFIDCIDVDEDGRIRGKWATLTRTVDDNLPTYHDAFDDTVKNGKPRYVLTPKNSVHMFFRTETKDLVRDKFGVETEALHYTEGIERAYLEPSLLTRLRRSIVVLGEMGHFGIKGEQEKVVGFKVSKEATPITAYVPMVKIKNHPTVGRAHGSMNSRADVLVEGRRPYDERNDSYRFEIGVSAEGPDFITGVFRSYGADENLRDYPLVLFHNTSIKRKRSKH